VGKSHTPRMPGGAGLGTLTKHCSLRKRFPLHGVMHVMGCGSHQSQTGLLAPSGHSRARFYRRATPLSLRYDHARSMRNALAGNLSPSLTACNTRPRWPCIRWLIGALLLLAFCPQVFIWELICRWPLGLTTDHGSGWSVPWLLCHLICRWPLGYWPPITALGDLLPDLSITWSTCHPASGPRGYLLLTSSTTDDRPDHLSLIIIT